MATFPKVGIAIDLNGEERVASWEWSFDSSFGILFDKLRTGSGQAEWRVVSRLLKGSDVRGGKWLAPSTAV